MPQLSPLNKQLLSIAIGLLLVSSSVWFLGKSLNIPILNFIGFMVGASTFIPMPADSYILAISDTLPAYQIGIIGGAVNATVVIIEAIWFRKVASYPAFETFKSFLGSNKFIKKAKENLFAALVLSGISPLPFEPFRLLAALSHYSSWKYALATFIGRGSRYYCLAAVGKRVSELGYFEYILWGSIILFLLGLVKSFLKYRKLQNIDENP